MDAIVSKTTAMTSTKQLATVSGEPCSEANSNRLAPRCRQHQHRNRECMMREYAMLK